MRWQNLQARSKLLRAIREVFWDWGFAEVDTPLIVSKPGQEPYLEPMAVEVQEVSGEKHTGFLITSPEYAMKKLLAKAAIGEAPEFEKIFQLAHVFRNNEDFGGTHNPEFTMLEWYRLDEDYNKLIEDVETLICGLARQQFPLERFRSASNARGLVTKETAGAPATLIYQGRCINLARPWKRLTVAQAFENFSSIKNFNEVSEDTEKFFEIFMKEVEPKIKALDYPVHLIDYPASQAALAKKKENNPQVAERVETYIAGMELTNGFSELTDAVEQRARFIEEQQVRAASGRQPIPLDEEFLTALPHIKKAAGISLGVDRLLMLLLDQRDINEVLFWPAKDLFVD